MGVKGVISVFEEDKDRRAEETSAWSHTVSVWRGTIGELSELGSPCRLTSAGKKIGLHDDTDVASFRMSQSFELDNALSQKLHSVIVSGNL